MANKFTQPQWDKVKNNSMCVVSFKNGIRTWTYGNLSYKDAMEQVIRKELEGEICLIIPSSNCDGIKGLENGREHNDEEDKLEYYLKCIQEDNKYFKDYLEEMKGGLD